MKRSLFVVLAVVDTPAFVSDAVAVDLRNFFFGDQPQRSGPVIQRQQPVQQFPSQQRYQNNRPPAQPSISPARRAAMQLQRNLNALGFDAGPVDGLPGRRTRAAVSAYQSSRGFRATGELTTNQELALATDAAAVGAMSDEEARRAEALELQTYLDAMGYAVGTPDGVWGPQSQRALEAFRQSLGVGAPAAGTLPGATDRAELYAQIHGTLPVGGTGGAGSTIAGGGYAGSGSGSGLGSGATSTVTANPSFDCARASTATESAICEDPGLAALDRELATAWSSARAVGVDAATQRAWIARRDACGAARDCIAEEMESRIERLTGAPAVAQYQPGGGAGGSGDAFATSTWAPDGGDEGTTAVPEPVAVDGRDYVHLFRRGDANAAAMALDKRLQTLGLKWRPEAIDARGVVEERYVLEQVAATGQSRREAQNAFNQRNFLEQEEILSAARSRFVLEAQQAPDITPEAPIKVALYTNRVAPTQLSYVEGKGMPFNNTVGMSGRFYRIAFDLGGDYRFASMTREEAKRMLDLAQAAWTDRREGLMQVFWVTITGFGTSADPTPAPSGNATPVEYRIDRVTLHFHDGGSTTPLDPADAVYTWAPPAEAVDPLAAIGDRPDALTLARGLGLPVVDGHVAYNSPVEPEHWGRFNLLAGLARDPAFFRDGTRYAPLISLLRPSEQTELIGPQPPYVNYLRPSLNWMNGGTFDNRRDQILASMVPDEFKRNALKGTFLERHWDALLSRTPRGPLPMRFVVTGRLGEYDFNGGFFPVTFSLNRNGGRRGEVRMRVAVTHDPESRYGGFASADRLANIPDKLFMPQDRAQALSRFMAENETQRAVYLVWWADLDWERDGVEAEQAFAAAEGRRGEAWRFLQNNPDVASVRASLKRIAIFVDDKFQNPLLELQPEQVLVPIPEAPKEPEVEQATGDMSTVLAQPIVTPLGMLAAVAEASGNPDGVYDAFAQREPAIKSANEFDQPGLIRALRARAAAERPEGAFWLEGTAELGRYDLATGVFALGSNLSISGLRRNSLPRTVRFVGLDDGFGVPATEQIARRIVEEEGQGQRRRVQFRMRARLAGAAMPYDKPVNVEALLQPEEIVFYRTYREGDTRAPFIVGRVDFSEKNAAKTALMEQTWTGEDFDGLAAVVPVLDSHVMDLLRVRAEGVPSDKQALMRMMMALQEHEQGASPMPGARFFTEGVTPFARTNDSVFMRRSRAETFLPRLSSFVAAKAAAMGARFAVEYRPNVRSLTCNHFSDNRNFSVDGPAAKALGISQAEVRQIEQLRNRDNGVERVDRRVMSMYQRSSERSLSRYCEPVWAMLSISNALVESRLDRSEGLRLEFDVEKVEVFPIELPPQHSGPTTSETVLIRAAAVATRVIAPNGEIGEPLVETPYVDQRALEAEARRQEAEERRRQAEAERQAREEEAARAAQAALSQSAGSGGVPSSANDPLAGLLSGAAGLGGAGLGGAADGPRSWPTLEGFEGALSARDILGLKTGIDMAEADRILRERGGIVAAFESAGPPAEINALGYRRVYLLRDGSETISLGSYSPDGKVIALMRRLVLAEGRLPYDRISQGLTGKYGDPDFQDPIMGLQVWGRDTLPEQCIEAHGMGGSNDLLSMKQLTPGEGLAADELFRRSSGMSWVMGLPGVPPETIPGSERCGRLLVYIPEHPETWGNSG
ncbi:MAG: peptidoglycan-binding protein, partial [Pseudomonadota bacterium]